MQIKFYQKYSAKNIPNFFIFTDENFFNPLRFKYKEAVVSHSKDEGDIVDKNKTTLTSML